ncbi:MAG: hypothetical protein EA368_12260 [Leptolyngbya sp. DLM2.Bin27]|nr:MAG: hypothetical protein EA368_12260 [Leptolyngbya sp. DLM2.Bin27]
MFESSDAEGMAPAPFTLPTYRQETLRHILLGDYGAVTDAIGQLVALGYSDKVAWSDPIPSGRSGEYLAVMTRRRGMRS